MSDSQPMTHDSSRREQGRRSTLAFVATRAELTAPWSVADAIADARGVVARSIRHASFVIVDALGIRRVDMWADRDGRLVSHAFAPDHSVAGAVAPSSAARIHVASLVAALVDRTAGMPATPRSADAGRAGQVPIRNVGALAPDTIPTPLTAVIVVTTADRHRPATVVIGCDAAAAWHASGAAGTPGSTVLAPVDFDEAVDRVAALLLPPDVRSTPPASTGRGESTDRA